MSPLHLGRKCRNHKINRFHFSKYIQHGIFIHEPHAFVVVFSGTAVQPICLPDSDDKVESGVICLSSGWGKISKSKGHQNDLILLPDLCMSRGSRNNFLDHELYIYHFLSLISDTTKISGYPQHQKAYTS